MPQDLVEYLDLDRIAFIYEVITRENLKGWKFIRTWAKEPWCSWEIKTIALDDGAIRDSPFYDDYIQIEKYLVKKGITGFKWIGRFKGTVLHEVSHAIVETKHGGEAKSHGKEFRRTFLRLIKKYCKEEEYAK